LTLKRYHKYTQEKEKNPTKPTKNVKKAHFFNNKKDF